MRKSRFTESQIVEILKEGEAGVPIAQLIEIYGKPEALRMDNGAELTSIAFPEWREDRRSKRFSDSDAFVAQLRENASPSVPRWRETLLTESEH